MENNSDQHSMFEKASWAFGIVGGIAGITTLITVFVAVGPIMLERIMLSNAKKEAVVGKWRSVVTSEDGFGIRKLAAVPQISLPQLVKQSCTLAPVLLPSGDRPIRCGWANFLDALGITPEDILKGAKAASNGRPKAFSTEAVTDLIEGKIPMRWIGSEFVSLCGLLGFQQQGRGYFELTHLPLPSVWTGPQGRIFLRQTQHGIVASLTPRLFVAHLIPAFVRDRNDIVRLNLRNRGLYGVRALPIDDEKALYLGGIEEWEDGDELKNPKKIWIIKENAIYHIIEDDILEIWGLSDKSIIFLGTHLVPESSPDPNLHEIAGYHAPLEVLALVKQAMTRIHPDGYLWTSHVKLSVRLSEIFQHSWMAGKKLGSFYGLVKHSWPSYIQGNDWTHSASRILPAFEAIAHIHKHFPDIHLVQSVTATSRDMRTISILETTMRSICGYRGGDYKTCEILWALICDPKLVEALVESFQTPPELGQNHIQYVFDAEGMIENGNFHFRPILGTRQFYIPAAGRDITRFNGVEILAALASFFFTGFWFTTRSSNSVCYEALCVPDTILLI